MGTIKFIERRLIFVNELKKLCVDHQWYTMGDDECYEKLFEKCNKPNITTEDIVEIAKDIHLYSNLQDMEFTDLCSQISEIAHTFFEAIPID